MSIVLMTPVFKHFWWLIIPPFISPGIAIYHWKHGNREKARRQLRDHLFYVLIDFGLLIMSVLQFGVLGLGELGLVFVSCLSSAFCLLKLRSFDSSKVKFLNYVVYNATAVVKAPLTWIVALPFWAIVFVLVDSSEAIRQ